MTDENDGKPSHIKINLDLSSDEIKKIISGVTADTSLTLIEAKRKLLSLTVMKVFFSVMVVVAVLLFPYEIIVNPSFGLSRAFALAFFGGVCALIALGVEDGRESVKRRIQELSAEASKAP